MAVAASTARPSDLVAISLGTCGSVRLMRTSWACGSASTTRFIGQRKEEEDEES